MKKKLILYSILFALGSFIVGLFIKNLNKDIYKSIKFSESEIYNFSLISKKGSTKYLFNGEKAVEEKKGEFKIKSLKGFIYKEKKVSISSSRAFLHIKENSIDLIENVKVKTRDVLLKTPSLHINFNLNIAKNSTYNEIYLRNSKTTGYNLFMDLKKENLSLSKVKTIIEGR